MNFWATGFFADGFWAGGFWGDEQPAQAVTKVEVIYTTATVPTVWFQYSQQAVYERHSIPQVSSRHSVQSVIAHHTPAFIFAAKRPRISSDMRGYYQSDNQKNNTEKIYVVVGENSVSSCAITSEQHTRSKTQEIVLTHTINTVYTMQEARHANNP